MRLPRHRIDEARNAFLVVHNRIIAELNKKIRPKGARAIKPADVDDTWHTTADLEQVVREFVRELGRVNSTDPGQPQWCFGRGAYVIAGQGVDAQLHMWLLQPRLGRWLEDVAQPIAAHLGTVLGYFHELAEAVEPEHPVRTGFAWMNATEIAAYCKVVPKTASRWIRNGTLQIHDENAQRYLMELRELDAKRKV